MKKNWHKSSAITIADKDSLRRSSADVMTRYLHAVIPLWIQHKFRDLGGFNFVADAGARMIGFFMIFSHPSLVFQFVRISRAIHVESFRAKDLECFLEHCVVSDKKIQGRHSLQERVLIFFHGGAWGSGSPWLYRLCAYNAAINLDASRLVLVGYPTFPASNIEMQSECVIAAIEYIQSKYKLSIKSSIRYIVMGHSSGANICGLAVNKIMDRRLKCKVDYFIGLSGVYDIGQHYLWERDRGVHLVSPMGGAALHFDNFSNCSPTLQLRRSYSFTDGSKLTNEYVINSKVMLLHGTYDCTVPVLSTIEYAESLRLHDIDVYTAYPEYDHMDPIIDLTIDVENHVTSDILKYFEMLITDDEDEEKGKHTRISDTCIN